MSPFRPSRGVQVRRFPALARSLPVPRAPVPARTLPIPMTAVSDRTQGLGAPTQARQHRDILSVRLPLRRGEDTPGLATRFPTRSVAQGRLVSPERRLRPPRRLARRSRRAARAARRNLPSLGSAEIATSNLINAVVRRLTPPLLELREPGLSLLHVKSPSTTLRPRGPQIGKDSEGSPSESSRLSQADRNSSVRIRAQLSVTAVAGLDQLLSLVFTPVKGTRHRLQLARSLRHDRPPPP